MKNVTAAIARKWTEEKRNKKIKNKFNYILRKIESAAKDGDYSIVSWYEPNREPDIDVTLFIALSKGDRLEWVIEKAVEIEYNNLKLYINKLFLYLKVMIIL